jgi:hypothetical protein
LAHIHLHGMLCVARCMCNPHPHDRPASLTLRMLRAAARPPVAARAVVAAVGWGLSVCPFSSRWAMLNPRPQGVS